ncbi:MAG: hypothetical protein GX458_02645 [Phyllobacteriaceae bacterium]|nr:hypothetical protein [Phyllobacteriaceae bacterium]
MRFLTIAVLALVSASVSPAVAEARAWMFCVVSPQDLHRATISEVFASDEGREIVEREIADRSVREGAGLPVVQCPLGNADRRVVEDDQARAFAFDRRLGLSVEGPVPEQRLR